MFWECTYKINLCLHVCVCVHLYISLPLHFFVVHTLLMSFLALLTEDTPLLPVEPVQACPQRNLQGQPENVGEGDKIGESVVKGKRGILGTVGKSGENVSKLLDFACTAFFCWHLLLFLIRVFCGYLWQLSLCGRLFNEGIKFVKHVWPESTVNNKYWTTNMYCRDLQRGRAGPVATNSWKWQPSCSMNLYLRAEG